MSYAGPHGLATGYVGVTPREETGSEMIRNSMENRRWREYEELRAAAMAKIKVKSLKPATVFVPTDDGVAVYDAQRLTKTTSALLLSGVADTSEEGFLPPLLQRERARLERVGLRTPTLTVRYRHVSVKARSQLGQSQVPTLPSATLGMLRSVALPNQGIPLTILSDVSGVVRPGRLTLLLGPPSSGKTTYLKALAGRGVHGAKIEGQITYNDTPVGKFVPERVASYISQRDLHYGELTVRETVEFAARCQASGHERDMLAALAEREAALGVAPEPELDAFMRAAAFGRRNNVSVSLVLRLLGLEGCADTLAGNAMLRGISGGQKKRLTSAEAMVSHSLALFADEISTGLDSATTHDIVLTLREVCHTRRTTYVIALLQPAPETYALFDDVLLMSAGMVCFHGPLDQVAPLFERLHFRIPPRVGAASFLQEVTVPSDQVKFWAGHKADAKYSYVTPREIQGAYEASDLWAAAQAELEEAFGPEGEGKAAFGAAPGKVHPGANRDSSPSGSGSEAAGRLEAGAAHLSSAYFKLPTSKYGTSVGNMIKANLRRSLVLQTRNAMFAYVRLFQLCLMGVALATLFLQTPKENTGNASSFMGAAFFSLMMQLIGGMPEMQLLTMRLAVFYKQREMRFYPGWCFALPTFLFRLPFSFVDSTLWSLVVYFAVGFDVSARFLMFWLLMLLTNVWSVSLFQALASICQTDTICNAVGSFFMLVFMLTGGFIVNKRSIPPWWIAAYWANPWSYLTQAIAINEFTSASWGGTNPADPNDPLPLGYQALAFYGFKSEYWWVWLGAGAIAFSMLVNFATFIVASTFMPPIEAAAILPPEALEELEYSRAGGAAPASLLNDVRLGQRRLLSAQATGEVEGAYGSFAATPRALSAASARSAERQAAALAAARSAGSDAALEPAPRAASWGAAAARAGPPQAGAAGGGSAASALPFFAVSMTFRHVSYSVPVPKGMDVSKADVPEDGPHAGQLRLLDDISGAFRPGVLTALMGASGAGKTTLMDVLAGRKTGGVIAGDVRVNGYAKNQSTFNRVSGYVEQEDVHLPQSSVGEALRFSAALRLPSSVDADTRERFVKEVIALVELDRLEQAFVGVPGESGLSIQQRKRLTIAVELVANPSAIFMDEPTTGLDARAATVVMASVRAVVDTGRTVVCTIHQPSLDIFEEFDELLLLKPGGRCVFFGALGRESASLIAYLGGVPGTPPLPAGVNPANWMLEVTGPAAEASRGVDYAREYDASQLRAAAESMLGRVHEPEPDVADMTLGELEVTRPSRQFALLVRRFLAQGWRLPDYNLTRFGVTLLVAFVEGSIAWKQGDDRNTVAGVMNIAGLLYMSTLFIGITNCMSIMPVAVTQRAVMYRERAAGMYGIGPYALAQGIVELPYILVQTVVYSAVVYWMMAFIPSAAKFFWFCFFFGLTLVFFTAFGLLCVALTPDIAIASLFSSFFFGFWNLICGFLQVQSAIPGWWIWAYYLNPVSWSLYGLIVSQLGDLYDEYIVNFDGQTVSISAFIQEYLGFKYSFIWPCVGILLGFIVVFRTSTFAALKLLNFQNR